MLMVLSKMHFSILEIICENPPIFNGMVVSDAVLFNTTYYYGNMVNFNCIEGYRLYGSSTIRCQANGLWSRMQGKCIRKN